MDWGSATAEQTDEPPSLIGTLVANKYRVDALLGSGSTGDVYLCTHIGLDKVVALKILHADMVKHENFVERFKREARAASKLSHPNSVRVLDFGEDPNGVLYIAMEYIAGRDLWSMLDEEWPLDNARIVDIMSQVLAALSKAHSLGIVHRDLKPENVMVQRTSAEDGSSERDMVTVCDFGIAQLSPIQLSGSFSPLTSTVTGDGMVVGTPAYMSPEQARAEPLDARSDVYSAGVVLFQMLTRQLPFTAETPLAVAVMHCSTPPPAPSQLALVHPALEAVCLRALSKTKEARYQSARDMQLALQDAMSSTNAYNQPGRKRRPYLPLSAPPLKLPAPRQSAAPASLAPFERTTDFTGGEPVPAAKRNVWVAVAMVVTIGAISLSPLFEREEEPAAAAANVDPRPAKPNTTAMEPTPVEVAPPVVAAPSEDPVASTAVAPAQPAPESTILTSEQLAAAPRVVRTAAPEPVRKPAQRAPAVKGGKPQPIAADPKPELALATMRAPLTAAFESPKARASTPDVAAKQSGGPVAQPNELEVKITADTEPEIPVGLVDLPSRQRPLADTATAEPKLASQPITPAVVTAGAVAGSFDHAQVRFASIVAQAAVSKASIRNALNEGAMRRCYSDALRLGAASPSPTSGRLDLETNMAGRIASATLSGAGLPKTLVNCIEAVAKSGRVREVDTGTARATVTLEFQP
ncbi:MAG TPA: protein kinase [Polyangiales bacterium]|nr:protein kinase [Polyangiales bacterium]